MIDLADMNVRGILIVSEIGSNPLPFRTFSV